MAESAAFSLRGLLLWVGLLLMCGAVALTAFLWFLFLVSVPIYLVGLVLVLVSGQPWWRMGLAIGFPFTAWVAIALGAWSLAPRERPITYLIPEGFEGPILVVKNERCGVLPEHEDGRAVYRVPASGLLITRDTVPHREHPYYSWPSRGYFLRPDNRYYLVDQAGHHRRELTEVHAATDASSGPDPTSSLLGVGRDELAAFYDSPIESAPDSTGGGRYWFQSVTVTTQNRLGRQELSDAQFRLRALADSLLPRCRVGIGQPPQGASPARPNPFGAAPDSPSSRWPS